MHVLIADDHPFYLSAVREQVERLFSGVVASVASTLDESLAILDHGACPDLALIDYSMPGMNGPASVRMVVAAAHGAPVMVMSGVAISSEVCACIGVGARGFLPKTLESKVFASALNVVLAGGSYLPAEMFATPCPAEAPIPLPAEEGLFNEREKAIMTMVVNGRSNKEIALLLKLREVTIKVQLTHIYKKLGAKNRAQAAMLVTGGHLLG